MTNDVSIKKLILVPALITLAVTLLRLTGELMHWSKALFNPAAGGGGARPSAIPSSASPWCRRWASGR